MSEAVLTPVQEQTEAEQFLPVYAPTDEEFDAAIADAADDTLTAYGIKRPDISHIITEDDEPVDNLPSEKYQRLLVEPLYTSPLLRRPFLASANVGIFGGIRQPPIVPDMFLSLDVQVADDWWAQENRSYFIWEFGKPPDVAIEIVSNRRGGETLRKPARYAQLRVTYYAIYDPQHLMQEEDLRVFELTGGRYQQRRDRRLLQVGLRLTVWEGIYEDKFDRWLRWCDDEGNLLLTGAELAAQAQAQAAQAQAQAAQERQRVEVLAAKLRELGIDPDQL